MNQPRHRVSAFQAFLKPLLFRTKKIMTDVFSKKKRSAIMAAIRSTGNKGTELKLAEILRKNGITGWRRHQSVFGKPDFIFRKAQLAVFVDGCFWHGHPSKCRMPHTNRRYWAAKIARNMARDKLVTRILRKKGWNVIRIWEDSVRKPSTVVRLRKALR